MRARGLQPASSSQLHGEAASKAGRRGRVRSRQSSGRLRERLKRFRGKGEFPERRGKERLGLRERMKKEQVARCQFSVWYPLFRAVTIRR